MMADDSNKCISGHTSAGMHFFKELSDCAPEQQQSEPCLKAASKEELPAKLSCQQACSKQLMSACWQVLHGVRPHGHGSADVSIQRPCDAQHGNLQVQQVHSNNRLATVHQNCSMQAPLLTSTHTSTKSSSGAGTPFCSLPSSSTHSRGNATASRPTLFAACSTAAKKGSKEQVGQLL